MQRTQHALASLIKVVTCAVLALGAAAQAQAQDKKADPTGTWAWTTTGQGGQERKTTLKLKLEGEKVTGAISAPGRQDAPPRETAIADGKLKGDEITFTVTREFQGNKMVAKYSGKVSADTIKGKIETERDGQARSRDWEAKRVVEKK
ncbi:MAG: hypothetical protein AAB676_11670 [Verrucomicrobiota bacterium]